MKIVTIEGVWLLHCCTKFQLDLSSHLWIILGWKLVERTHTSGRQLKIIFLEVLDHSEYSDTNISNFFSRKQQKNWENWFISKGQIWELEKLRVMRNIEWTKNSKNCNFWKWILFVSIWKIPKIPNSKNSKKFPIWNLVKIVNLEKSKNFPIHSSPATY